MCAVLLTVWLCSASSVWAQSNMIRFDYRRAAVDNPLKGLVPYQHPAADRFPHSMEFNYLPLSKLVIGEKVYDWRPLERLLEDIRSRGNQTVFRIFLEYPKKKNCIPRYLVDAGLKIHRYKNTNTAPFPPAAVETPDYEDPRLRRCLQDFIAALGRKYDGDPRVAYITAGLLGTWGEWHTYPRDDLWASKRTQNEVLDAYERAFKKTPILLRYPAKQKHYAQAANHRRPFGYHDDSFAYATLDTGRSEDDWYFEPALVAAQATKKWQQHPIGGEIRPEVWGCCFDSNPCTKPDQAFAACRDKLHVTWLMDTGLFEKPTSAERLQRATVAVQKMGYEFQVTRVQRDQRVIQVTVKNTGIAPFYHADWTAELAFLRNGQLLGPPTQTNWELTKLLPGATATKSWTLRSAPRNDPPNSRLALRIANPMPNGKPLRFANVSQDADRDGWLTLWKSQ